LTVFDWVCARLQQSSSLSELEARGTVRLALKQAGLDARSVSASEMAVVLRKVLPGELAQRAVEGAGPLCEALAERVTRELGDAASPAPGSSVEAVFRRLGGSSA